MKLPTLTCEQRLALEQRNHAEAFATLARSLDQQNERLVDARRELALVAYRNKARWWFRGRAA